MADPVVVPVPPDPTPPEPRSWRTQGRGRATIDADWSRWPLVQPEALLARLRELGALLAMVLLSCAPVALYGAQPGAPCSGLVRCEVPLGAPGKRPAAYCGTGLRCCATVAGPAGTTCTDCGEGWVCR